MITTRMWGEQASGSMVVVGERVLGVDACKAGWVGVVLAGGRTSVYCAPVIDELVAVAEADGPPAVVAIDMPIGLPDRGCRRADLLAREVVGAMRSSVFVVPVRAAMEVPDYPAAGALNRELTGAGMSRQAFALRPKLLQVDRWVRRAGRRVVEVHPEVSFAELAGVALDVRKSTWAGVERRRQLLAAAGITLTGDLGAAGRQAGMDDVLDAAVAAWTARRVTEGRARSRPDPPEVFSDGLPAAIWS